MANGSYQTYSDEPVITADIFRLVVDNHKLDQLVQYFQGAPERFISLRKQWSSEAANKVKIAWQQQIRMQNGGKLQTNWTGQYANSLTVRGNQYGSWIAVTGQAKRYFAALEGGSKPLSAHMLSQQSTYGSPVIREFQHSFGQRYETHITGAKSVARKRNKYNYYPITTRQAQILGIANRAAKDSKFPLEKEGEKSYMGFAKRIRQSRTVFNDEIGVRGEFHTTGHRNVNADTTHMQPIWMDPKTGEIKHAYIYDKLGYHGYGVADIVARGRDSKNRKSVEQVTYHDTLGHEKVRDHSPHLKGRWNPNKGGPGIGGHETPRAYGQGTEAGRRFYQMIHGKGEPKEQLYMREREISRRVVKTGRKTRIMTDTYMNQRANNRFNMNSLSVAERRLAESHLGQGLGGDGTATGRIMEWAMSRFPQTYRKDYINPKTGQHHKAGSFAYSKSRQNAYRILRWIRTHGTKPTHILQTVAESTDSGLLHRTITDLAFNLGAEFINIGLEAGEGIIKGIAEL